MKSLLIAFLLTLCHAASAQIQKCGHNLLINQMELRYPGVKNHADRTFSAAKKAGKTSKSRINRNVKVVFHVLYENPNENIPDEVLIQQLDQLNLDFNRANTDADSTRAIFADIASGLDVAFELAEIDPDGNPTTGINRVPTTVTSFFDLDILAFATAAGECGIEDLATVTPEQQACLDSLGIAIPDLNDIKKSETGGVEPWDTERYLNIWVGDYSISLFGQETPLVLGFAFPPFGLWGDLIPYNEEEMKEIDGVTIHYQAIGPNNMSSGPLLGTNDLGRTLTHEVGHYLGLRHVWGDGDCTEDDGIEDTPSMANNTSALIQEEFPFGADLSCRDMDVYDSCTADDLPDIVENYMNYANEACQNMFTAGQAAIMEAVLDGPRASLLSGSTAVAEKEDFSFDVFPNPAQNQIQLRGIGNNVIAGKIMGIDGRTVITFDNTNISIADLPSGVYIIQLQRDTTTVSKMFMKK